MSGPPSHPVMGDDTGDRESATGTSRVLRVLGIAIAIGLVVLVVILHFTGTLGTGAH